MWKIKIITVQPFKACTRIEVKLHSFIISALHGRAWWTSRTGRFALGIEPRYPLNRRLVDLEAGLNIFWQEVNFLAYVGLGRPDRSAGSTVNILAEPSELH